MTGNQRVAFRSAIGIMALGLTLAACGGGGSSSTGSSTTVTVTAPGAPTIGAATAGNASASIAFTAPASTGGATITGYTATCTATGQTTSTASGSASPVSVGSLANGVTYNCSVTATNSAGTGPASGSVSVTPSVSGGTGATTTASVLCPYNQSTFVASFGLTSTSSWTCSSTRRSLTANGIPDHTTGPFSNPAVNFTMKTQSVSFSAILTPALASATNTDARALAYALNGVKIDPGTGGSCPSTVTSTSDCSLLPTSGMGPWRMEALGQTTFDFGADLNNAHVQPDGAYHYHGVPEGILTKNGVSSSSPKMLLIAWAPDGYPMYARYGYSTATSAASALKVIKSSYALKATPDSGRPSTTLIPMGAFTQDYQYNAGSGDLDECNGRFDVTPEFPNGIYHYYSTDTYPFMPRCWKGTVS